MRLTPGEHDLSLSYVAPAPSWRVSYRLVVEEEEEGKRARTERRERGGERRALLLGWGIFDNRLEEDLKEISLSLVAGMPISFVYDLVTPFTPERPESQGRKPRGGWAGQLRRGRAAGGRPCMAAAMALDEARRRGGHDARRRPGQARRQRPGAGRATTVAASGADLGELFEYAIATPVTVGRGQSAMVPIVSARLDCRKDLLYNGSKLARHPVATLRMRNNSGLTLERGPVTVIDSGQYAGEAVLPFTAVERRVRRALCRGAGRQGARGEPAPPARSTACASAATT